MKLGSLWLSGLCFGGLLSCGGGADAQEIRIPGGISGKPVAFDLSQGLVELQSRDGQTARTDLSAFDRKQWAVAYSAFRSLQSKDVLRKVEPPREFQSSDGKRLTASLVGASETEVMLRLPNGSSFTLPLDRFAKTDQDHIKGWRMRNPLLPRLTVTLAGKALRKEKAVSPRTHGTYYAGTISGTVEIWEYEITVKNQSSFPAPQTGLYWLARIGTTFKEQARGSEPIYQARKGLVQIPSIEPGESVSVRSGEFPVLDVTLVTRVTIAGSQGREYYFESYVEDQDVDRFLGEIRMNGHVLRMFDSR